MMKIKFLIWREVQEKLIMWLSFLENITSSKNFKLYNYDYILRKENEIEFKLEIKYF